MNHFKISCEWHAETDADNPHDAEFQLDLMDSDEMKNDPYFVCGAALGEVVAKSNETVGILELHITKLDQ